MTPDASCDVSSSAQVTNVTLAVNSSGDGAINTTNHDTPCSTHLKNSTYDVISDIVLAAGTPSGMSITAASSRQPYNPTDLATPPCHTERLASTTPPFVVGGVLFDSPVYITAI